MRLVFIFCSHSYSRMQSNKWLILSDRPGQLGNLLFLYAHFAAYCMKNKVALINPAFSEHAQEFHLKTGKSEYDALLRDIRVLNFPRANIILKILRRTRLSNQFLKAYSLANGVSYDLDSNLSVSTAKYNFIAGWLYRGENNLKHYKTHVKSMFQLNDRNAAMVDSYVQGHFLSQGINIGVHIRQGDYAGFEGGRYYFDSAEYATILSEVAHFYRDKKVRFHICSNVEQEIGVFEGLDVSLSKASPVIDLYTLSRCDLILGPPSTFTLWASFMTGVHILTLKRSEVDSIKEQMSLKNDQIRSI